MRVQQYHLTNMFACSAAAKSSCLSLTSPQGSVDRSEDASTEPADLGQDFFGLCLTHTHAWTCSTEQSHQQCRK